MSERVPAIKVVMMPKDTNAHGTIFGGVILSNIDLASGVEAFKVAPHLYVTKAMREVEFHEPVYTGDLVSRGYCPVVFPEGLRTPDGQIKTFRPGVGMMAVRLRVPIVPIRLSGLYEIYSIHDSWPRRGPVHVSIGKALEFPAGAAYEEATQRLEETLKGM